MGLNDESQEPKRGILHMNMDVDFCIQQQIHMNADDFFCWLHEPPFYFDNTIHVLIFLYARDFSYLYPIFCFSYQ